MHEKVVAVNSNAVGHNSNAALSLNAERPASAKPLVAEVALQRVTMDILLSVEELTTSCLVPTKRGLWTSLRVELAGMVVTVASMATWEHVVTTTKALKLLIRAASTIFIKNCNTKHAMLHIASQCLMNGTLYYTEYVG